MEHEGQKLSGDEALALPTDTFNQRKARTLLLDLGIMHCKIKGRTCARGCLGDLASKENCQGTIAS